MRWWTVKYEEAYLKAYANVLEAQRGLEDYFRFYNDLRPHRALGYQTPAEVFPAEQRVVEEGSSRPRTNWKPLKLPPTLPSHCSWNGATPPALRPPVIMSVVHDSSAPVAQHPGALTP